MKFPNSPAHLKRNTLSFVFERTFSKGYCNPKIIVKMKGRRSRESERQSRMKENKNHGVGLNFEQK